MLSSQPVVSFAVEGTLDEAVAQRLLSHIGATPGRAFVKRGKGSLEKALAGINRGAEHGLWFVLLDLDRQGCPGSFRDQILEAPAAGLCCRIAVQEVEAWLLADGESIARFLRVPESKIPLLPEQDAQPARRLVQLARSSSSRSIRSHLVPPAGSSRKVGAGYNSLMVEYVRRHWQPERAAERSRSLKRCIARLRELVRPT